LQDAHEELRDWLGFVGDLFELGIPELTDALTQCGFSAGENGFGVMSADAQSACAGLLVHEVESTQEDNSRDSANDTSPHCMASDRLEAVLKHYNEKEMLPFPYDLKSPENIAAILSSVATTLVP
jgi:hypothetical protein